MITLEPCPHCGTMLTPALVKEIADPNGAASCPRRPRIPISRHASLMRAAAPAFDRFNAELGRAVEQIERLLRATEPRGERGRRG